MRSIVIVGAGQGGVSAAESLRERGYDERITLYDASIELPYRRPPLSKAFLSGDVDRATLAFRPFEFYEQLGIDLELGAKAVGVDHAGRQVEFSDGRRAIYDHLILATGSTPRPWTGAGTELDGVFQLAIADDADRLRESLAKARTLTVIGGGFIGLEVASQAAKAGLTVTVLETAERVMARALSPFSAEHLSERHRASGVAVRTGVGVDAIVGSSGVVSGVRLLSGEIVPSDLVLVCVGSAAVTGPVAHELVDKTLCAIRVDEFLQTADPHISAIGDAAAFPRDGRHIRLESVQNATDQARSVASRLTGNPARYAAVPWFWTEQAGIKVQMAGLTTGADQFVVRGHPSSDRFSVFAFRNARLLGAESFGRPADHIATRNLLAANDTLSPEQASDEEFNLTAHARVAAARV